MRSLLDDFTRGYCEAALWTGDPRPGKGEKQADLSLIPDDVLADAAEDCRQFQQGNADLLNEAAALVPPIGE